MFTVNTAISNPNNIVLDESSIAWTSDKDKFVQPSGFRYVSVTDPTDTCEDADLPSDCKKYTDPATGTLYYFYYPNDDTVQYLYESYPAHISPIVGVTDQHFKVWMRPAALPQFRKLYGEYSKNHV